MKKINDQIEPRRHFKNLQENEFYEKLINYELQQLYIKDINWITEKKYRNKAQKPPTQSSNVQM